MPILVSCSCGKQMRAKDEMAGKRVKCPGCGSPVVVAAITEDVPELVEAVTPIAPKSRPPEEDDRSEPDETPYVLVTPKIVGSEVIALSDDALFVATLDETQLKKVRKAISKNVPVEEALDETTTVIRFDQIDKVQSNLHGKLVEVFWQPDEGGEKQEVNIFCDDKEARDGLMEAFEDRLRFQREVIEVGRLRASLGPLAVIGLFSFILFCFIMAATQTESDGGGTKVVRTNIIGVIFIWIYNFFGPIGVILLGSPFVIGGIVWLVMVLRNPPILLTLTPRKRGGKRRD